MKVMFSYALKYKFKMILAFIIKIFGTLLELVIPFLLTEILDYLEVTTDSSEALRFVLFYGALMILAAAFCFILNVTANRIGSWVAKMATYDLRKDLFNKIIKLEAQNINQISIPSLISRMTTDTYNINTFLRLLQSMGVRAPILLIGGVAMTSMLDPVLTLVLVACIPLILIVVLIVSKFGVRLFTAVQQGQDKVVLKTREDINGIKVIKSLNKEDYEQMKFNQVNQELSNAEIKANTMMAYINPIINIIMNVGLVAVILIGAYRVYDGSIKTPIIIAFLTYFTIILNGTLAITRIFINMSKARSSSNRINEILQLDNIMKIEEIDEHSDYFIEFRNVTFGYNQNPVINNVSFSIKQGESLGIIGATGSGKSTIIALLLRFYDPISGDIYINHKNIKSYPLKELRNNIGIAFQNDTIFEKSISDNITLNRDIDNIHDAIQNACATYIHERGLDYTLTSNGSNLSGGERQRVLLARALAGNPNLIILDDSQSALDYKTDQNLRSNLYSNFKDTSKVIVASRISSIANCDKIILLEDGIIKAIGKHEELLVNNIDYKKLYIMQVGGDINEL